MDDDTRHLVILLATRIGMILEDVSPIALTLAGQREANFAKAVEELSKASRQVAILVAAIGDCPLGRTVRNVSPEGQKATNSHFS